jgi:putative aldouronate transport system substrate-binding protein
VTEWNQLTPFLEDIKQGEPDVIAWEAAPPFRPEIYGWDPIDEGISGEQGSSIVVNASDKELKAFFTAETPEFEQFVKLMREWYLAGYFPKEADPDATSSWKAGKYVLWSHLIDPRMRAWNKDLKGWDFVGKPLTDPIIMTTGSVIATLNAVCSTSAHPDKAVRFLNLINTDPELYNLMNYGIEGKHWMWVDEQKKLIGPPEGKTWADTGYHPDTLWMYGSNWLAYYTSQADADGDTWTKVKAVNDGSTPSQALGFTFDRASVQTEIANVNAASAEFCGPIVTGTADPEEGLPLCIAKLKEAGIDTIIQEMQKQLDLFSAMKK